MKESGVVGSDWADPTLGEVEMQDGADMTRFCELNRQLQTATSVSDPGYVQLFEAMAQSAPPEIREDAALVASISIACYKGLHEIAPGEPEYHAASRRLAAYVEQACGLKPMVQKPVSPEQRAHSIDRFAERGITLRLRS